MKRIYYYLLLSSVLLFYAGCKKKQDKKPECRIARITEDGIQTWDFTYDTEGRLSSILAMPINSLMSYSYEGSKTTIARTKNGNFISRLIVTNNAHGLATNVLYHNNQSGSSWYNLAFTYEGNKITSILATDAALDTFKTDYIWDNGDPSVMVSDGDVFKFKYYMDKPYQPGDWRYIQQIVSGYRIYDNEHLLQSTEANGNMTYYTYKFDEAGRITEATGTSNNQTNNITIAYECTQ